MTNQPPRVSITWPHAGPSWDHFLTRTLIKIKAEADDPDGSISQVEFFVLTNRIGVVTNAPFNLLWFVGEGVPLQPPLWTLRAVATDNLGAQAQSAEVRLGFSDTLPTMPVVEIVSPPSGTLFPAPATFVFSAEVLASDGDAGPIEFFVGTNSVGIVDNASCLTADTPPSSITLSNLVEGQYTLSVRYLGLDGMFCISCLLATNTIRVVNLGVRAPGLTSDNRLEFEVLTSFPGKVTVIEASGNLGDWTPILTNQPSSNRFIFTEPFP
ncbi:MAG TPA: Ig-like domain-containing protein, partial [Candidatus Binatia bacterium]|nr:Ig-like domain-containing protein [Candidatus Binatia bacterium]